MRRPSQALRIGAPLFLLLLIVALGTRGIPGAGERAGHSAPSLDLTEAGRFVWFFVLVLAFLFLGAILWALKLAFTGRQPPEARSTAIGLLLGLAVIVTLAMIARRLMPEQEIPDLVWAPSAPPVSATETEVVGTPWALLTLLAGLMLATWALSTAHRQNPTLPSQEDESSVRDELRTIFDDAISALDRDGDPRSVTISAYVSIERSLARAGMPRRPSEAPGEYLRRVLDGMSVSPEATTRLTRLFEVARFSDHPIDRHMAGSAIDDMTTIRSDLTEVAR